MNNNQQVSKLNKCLDETALCAVEREIIDTFLIYGFPVDMSSELAVMAFVYDFMSDGYKIIRKSDITGVYCGDEERFLEKVIKTEHSDFSIKSPDLKIDNMRVLCEDLMEKGQIITVECEDFEENIMLIGKVVAVNDTRLTLRTFNGVGVWDKQCASVDMDDVTCVSVGNSYVNIISKYLEEK